MVQDQEPLFAREGLFRQKLNQLRKTGEIQQQRKVDTDQRLKELEQGGFLTNVKSTLPQADPKEMERITLLDGVTELYNHSTVTRILKDELKRSKRYKHNCSLIMLLIDGLYGIQQSHGPDVSDSILRGVADFLMKTVRDVDVPARFSAEQFVIMLPETDLAGTQVLADRIRQKIQVERVSDLTQNWHVTLSIGIASFPTSAGSYEELMKKLQSALDSAINKGGNSVIAAE